MAKPIKNRVCAELDGEFVVFLLGARISNPLKFWKWRQLAKSMRAMRTELAEHPELGLLHSQDFMAFPDLMSVQYWRSFDHLESYSRARDREHFPAWQAFHKTIGMNDDVGIWHETYLIQPGRYETIYGSVPPMGLGVWTRWALGRTRATGSRPQRWRADPADQYPTRLQRSSRRTGGRVRGRPSGNR